MEVFRPSVPIGDCISMREASLRMGANHALFFYHKSSNPEAFPKPVARIGKTHLYVWKELEAYYKSVLWNKADKSIEELTGDLRHA